MAVKTESRFDGPAVVIALSAPFPNASSDAVAQEVIGARYRVDMLERLYPRLLKQKTLTNALVHLKRAGADLSGFTVSADQFAKTYPLNRLLPPLPAGATRVSFEEIREGLKAQQGLLEEVVGELAEAAGAGRLILAKGQAYRASYPAYPRWCSDIDVFVPDDETAIHLLDEMDGRMGFAMHGCKVGASSVMKAFRHIHGHEVNVGLHVGGPPSGIQALPLGIALSDPSQARAVEVGGMSVLASSPEGLLLTTALRPIREGYFAVRGVNDIRCVLTRDAAAIDWEATVRVARANALHGALHALLRTAERAEGRALVPSDVMSSLVPGRLSRKLFAIQLGQAEQGQRAMVGGRRARAQRLAARALRSWWMLQFAQRAVGAIRGSVLVIRDRPRLRRFYSDIEARRSGAAGHGASEGASAFRSLCEFRKQPAPLELGFCVGLSADNEGPPSRLVESLVRHLPDAGQEATLRKRTTIGAVQDQPHRCESFLVYTGPA